MSNIDEISKQVEADRARLAGTLDALTDTVKPQAIAQEATTAATDIGGDLALKAWNALRDQPAGGLLVTIGMGLLAAGSQRRPLPVSRPQTTANHPHEAMDGFDDRVAAADVAMRENMTGEIEPQPQASKLKSALNTGLDQLPPNARRRVVKAREAAIAAQESIERQTRVAARKTKGFVYEQPLTVGALALGFGILAGSLLPGTRREDALLGARRDALMADARNALEEEMLKAKAQAETALADKVGTTPAKLRA
ncbi:DUF3618 domain-containing protein [Roseobacter sp. CCS2]|uniref:DUF3618 domain-containing protein n=1 Tax=Roseobacter sp. CCS2 TaxID=391593 RepID=UPI0000F3F17F|nr:DUF3618 domain-containing protein [Roseobacter sp. CCS2]EBA11166.1 hypothetical protein RCCS2_10355 [Roseobacter sp. CCS2]